MNPTYTLRYVGQTPRSNLNDHWCIWATNTNSGPTSFFYFASLEEAVAKYPQARDQAIAFHLDHAQRELNDFAAPGCDDPHTIRLLNARLTACRELLAGTPITPKELR